MSFLSKAGQRFKIDLKRIPKFRIGRYKKMEQETYPLFLRPSDEIDIQADNKVPSKFSKLKFLVGDRVMIVKGPNSGNICKVSSHAEGGRYVLDQNGPTQTVPIPKIVWQDNQQSHVITAPRSISGENLRLVAEIEDEKTGKMKTVAIDNLEFRGKYYDGDYKKVLQYRTVKGHPELSIPYPRPEPKEDGPLSTDVDTVRERTHYIETAVRSSIPESALLTIRNPYSNHRRSRLGPLDVKRLTPPSMPLSETKKAYYAEKEQIKKLPQVNITNEMKHYLGVKIKDHEKVKAKQWEAIKDL